MRCRRFRVRILFCFNVGRVLRQPYRNGLGLSVGPRVHGDTEAAVVAALADFTSMAVEYDNDMFIVSELRGC